jgi:hypothetical protein
MGCYAALHNGRAFNGESMFVVVSRGSIAAFAGGRAFWNPPHRSDSAASEDTTLCEDS